MRTRLDSPTGTLDRDEQDFVANIREFGWHSTSVLADDEGPGFSYTTGFWLNLGVPEVILFSLDAQVAHDVLWDVYREAKNGREFPEGVRLSDILGNADCFLMPVGQQHYAKHLGWNRWFYGGDEFPCVQLVWPDRRGRFPWQADADDAFKALQLDISPAGWVKALTQ
jgi:Domain of unknown function (DUF4262)